MNSQFVQREHDRLLRELFDFLSIPSVSTAPEHALRLPGRGRVAGQALPRARLPGLDPARG